MATNRTNLTISDLDFDSIKDNLKSYLQGQTSFADYNFEGSGLNILLDILAYNTHYEAFYNNMIANEMFLDSAQDRANVVSIAKHLGYTPTSRRAAEATVNVTLGSTAGFSDSYYLPKGEIFSASKDGINYSFVVKDPVLIDLTAANGYHFSNVVLQQGKARSVSFIYDSRDPDKKFIIPEDNVDTSTLVVRVQNSPTDTTGYTDLWSLGSDFNDLTATSKAYFLQEADSNKYEVYFGDGVIGKALEDNNLVIFNYVVTDGDAANSIGFADSADARSFGFGSGNTVVVVEQASGGAERETVGSIRFRAPIGYQAQNRAVTIRDYQSILVSDYPDIESVSVWGGEDNDPPEYGTVFIAFKPDSGLIIPESRKDAITNSLLESKNIVGVRTKVVDPDYVYLRIVSNVTYNKDLASISQSAMANLVSNAVTSWINNNLEKFDKGLRYSKFVKMIDDAESSILGNETDIVLEKRYSPDNNTNQSFKMEFYNPIEHPHEGHRSGIVSSTKFEVSTTGGVLKTVYLEDDGYGVIDLIDFNNGNPSKLVGSVGSVDYENGIVTVSGLNIQRGIDFTEVRVRVIPRDLDIDSVRRSILVVDPDDSGAVTIRTIPSSSGY
jgi:hypothetical protein